MAAPNTLADIRTKVRRLTARGSANQITDNTIDQYINTYYLYDMPEALRVLKLQDVYTFQTAANVDTYPFPSNTYTSSGPPAYCAGQQMQFFNDADSFYRTWPKIQFIRQIATGNGGVGPYTGTITGVPFLRSVNATTAVSNVVNLLITANTAAGTTSALDDGVGGFLAPAAGTINYTTGAVSVSFSQAVPAGNAITAEVVPFSAAQPRMILFYQNQFTLRPVPDKGYNIQVQAYRVPTDLLNAGTSPELNEWWQLLAFGAARKILVDNGDYEFAVSMQPYYEEQFILCMRRTLNQLTPQRVSTIFSESNSYPYSNLYPYI